MEQKITAYDFLHSINLFQSHLEENELLATYAWRFGLQPLYAKYCDIHFTRNFCYPNGEFKGPQVLTLYDYQLFNHHPATVENEEGLFYKGYYLGK